MHSTQLSIGDTVPSLSTNATAPNQAGPGRGLGQLYDFGGAALERGLGRAAKALGIKPADDAQSFHRETAEERDAMVYNQPGIGRTLDLFYSWAGEQLEFQMNKTALILGYGPDAAVARIEKRLKKIRWGVVDDLLYEHVQGKGFDRMNDMKTSRKLVKECRRLLKYIDSEVPSNRRIALQQICRMTLADPALRHLFVYLGACDILIHQGIYTPIHSRSKESNPKDPLMLLSREAYICLSDVRVHSIGLKVHDPMFPDEASALQLLDYATDPNLSFLALRHLRRYKAVLVDANAFYERLVILFARFAAESPEFVEWDSLDVVLANSLWETYKPDEVSKKLWKALLDLILRNAHRIPRVAKRLSDYMSISFDFKDEDITSDARFYWRMLLDIGATGENLNAINSLSSVQSRTNYTLSPSAITTLAIRYSSPLVERIWEPFMQGPNNVYLRLECLGVDRRWEEWFMPSIAHPSSHEWNEKRFLCSRLVEYLSSPHEHVNDEATRAILRLRRMDRYIWGEMCNMLYATLSALASAPPTQHGSLVDDDVADSDNLHNTSSSSRLTRSFHYILDQARVPSMYRPESIATPITLLKKLNRRPPHSFGVARRWCGCVERFQYRNLGSSTWFPPMLCHDRGKRRIDNATGNAQACVIHKEELLHAYVHGLLLLDVPPGENFCTDGHHPLFAGISREHTEKDDEITKREYLAVIGPSADTRAGARTHPIWCTVREGDSCATYWVEKSRHQTGGSSQQTNSVKSTSTRLVRRTAADFQVLVLRFEPNEYGPAATSAPKAMGGRDATGPYFWGRVFSRGSRAGNRA